MQVRRQDFRNGVQVPDRLGDGLLVVIRFVPKPLKEASVNIYRKVEEWIRTIFVGKAMDGVQGEKNCWERRLVDSKPAPSWLPRFRYFEPVEVRAGKSKRPRCRTTRHRLRQPLAPCSICFLVAGLKAVCRSTYHVLGEKNRS